MSCDEMGYSNMESVAYLKSFIRHDGIRDHGRFTLSTAGFLFFFCGSNFI